MKNFTTLAIILIASFALPAQARDPNTAYDTQFLDTMAEHHRAAIQMMQMAKDKAQRQDIRKMAQEGAQKQTREIAELKSLRHADAPDAVNSTLPGMMPKVEMDRMMAKLEAASGNAFDRQFLQAMITHHKGAVKMSEDALAHAKGADVKAKAQEIHDTQNSEISEMQAMLGEMP